jgi:hypothetical protein
MFVNDNKKHATKRRVRALALALLTEHQDTGMHDDLEKARGPPSWESGFL